MTPSAFALVATGSLDPVIFATAALTVAPLGKNNNLLVYLPTKTPGNPILMF